MKKRFVLLVTFCLLIFVACSDDTDDPSDPTIRGKVTNAAGESVENALIELSFNVTQIERQLHVFDFELENPGYVKLWLTRYDSDDTVKVLVDKQFNSPGNYTASWKGTNSQGKYVVSHVYVAHMQVDDNASVAVDAVYHEIIDYSQADSLEKYEYYAKTDEHGEFAIEQDGLPFGFQYSKTYVAGGEVYTYKISRYIEVWALHEDYSPTACPPTFVDSEKGLDVSLEFEE